MACEQMRLTVNDPTAVPALVAALRSHECLAEAGDGGAIEVLFPWLEELADARQAVIELAFFTRTWEALHPGVQISLVSAAP
jgi:hypothetical protein